MKRVTRNLSLRRLALVGLGGERETPVLAVPEQPSHGGAGWEARDPSFEDGRLALAGLRGQRETLALVGLGRPSPGGAGREERDPSPGGAGAS
jgi:hypothetical protein